MKTLTLFLSLLLYSTALMAQPTNEATAKPAKPDISIVEAAEKGDLEKVKQHLAAGTDINDRDGEHESTALHAAAYHGKLEIVKFLIEKDAEINFKNKHGQTPRDIAWHEQENHENLVRQTGKPSGKLANSLRAKEASMDMIGESPRGVSLPFFPA